jgi:hypothetical protein
VQGRPGERFVYVNSGTLAHQPMSCWTRRAKIFLDPIADLVAASPSSATFSMAEARIPGRVRNGGPVCARTEVFGTWRLVE